jgi:probable HAF family extracellular repeat protein
MRSLDLRGRHARLRHARRPSGVGRSINEAGQIAGESQTQNGGTHAFRFTEGVGMVDPARSAGRRAPVMGSTTAARWWAKRYRLHHHDRADRSGLYALGTHAFLWTEGAGMVDLGHLGGGDSQAHAINNHGIVVGTSELPNGTSHAFRWTSAEGMVDLNTLLPPGAAGS